MKTFLKLSFLLLLIGVVACDKKDQDDYQPPSKGNVSKSYFVNTEWTVENNSVFVPNYVNDDCIANLKAFYFGDGVCILSCEQEVNSKKVTKAYNGQYRIENDKSAGTTYLYLDNMTNDTVSLSYVMLFSEINASQKNISLIMDVRSGNHLPARNEGYGTLRLKKK
jgi:hypothetical protein